MDLIETCTDTYLGQSKRIVKFWWPRPYLQGHQLHIKLEDLKVLRRSPDLFNNVKIGKGQLQLTIKHIWFYHIWGLQPFWSSDLKQSNEYSIKQPSDFWATNVNIGRLQSKWDALDKRSQVSLTFGTYIKPLSHKVKHFSKVLWFLLKQS